MECVTAGNLLVHLFFQTKPKYLLSNKKLQYLLCIAQLVSVSSGRFLFADSMRNLKNGFVLEIIADTFMCNSYIQEGTTADRKMNMVSSDLHLPYSKKKLYEIKENVSEEDKALLIDVFINFGAYKEETLRKLLNEFHQLRNVPLWSYVSPEDISSFFEKAFYNNGSGVQELKSNKIFILCQESHNNAFAKKYVEPINTDIEPISTAVISDVPITASDKVVSRVCLLEPFLSLNLNTFVTDKKCRIYIETEKVLQDVIIVALKDQSRVYGELKQLNKNIYCYSFVSTPSDIKVYCKFNDNV